MKVNPIASASLPQKTEDVELRNACREFEALFVTQLLRKMRDTIPKTDLFGSKEKEEVFQNMLDQEIGKDVARTGAMKLGEMIYAQLSKGKENR